MERENILKSDEYWDEKIELDFYGFMGKELKKQLKSDILKMKNELIKILEKKMEAPMTYFMKKVLANPIAKNIFFKKIQSDEKNLTISKNNNQMKVFAFLYNDCIYESAEATVSLHLTRKGAQSALRKHKAKKKKEWKEIYSGDFEAISPFGTHEWWGVCEMEILNP